MISVSLRHWNHKHNKTYIRESSALMLATVSPAFSVNTNPHIFQLVQSNGTMVSPHECGAEHASRASV